MNNYSLATRYDTNHRYNVVLIMVCIYIFLVIERPWESIRYLEGIQIERSYAILLIIIAFLHHKFRIVSSPTNKWVYGLLILHFILAPYAYNSGYAFDQGIEYSKMVVLYLLMLSVADDEESLKLLIKVYVFSMIFYTFHSLWEFHNGRHEYRMGIVRMIGVGDSLSDPNAFGASLLLSLPFVYALYNSEKSSKIKKLFICYSGAVVLCVVLTGSRSTSITLVFLFLLGALLQQGKRKLIILFTILIAMSILWVSIPADKQERIRSIWDKDAGQIGAQSSTEGRKFGFLAGWKMFQSSPFTGIGAGGKNFVNYRVEHLDGISEQAHNLYGQILAAFGVGGAFLFIGLVSSTLGCCFKVIKYNRQAESISSFSLEICRAIMICLVLLLVLGMAGHNFYRPLWLWLAAWSSRLLCLQEKRISSKILDDRLKSDMYI